MTTYGHSSTANDFKAYTDSVISAIGPKASDRVKKAFPILIRKLHEAVIEAEMTTEEWLAACNLLVEAGQVSNKQRNEVVLVSDVLGIESLVDMLEHARYMKQGADTTHSAILGPFYREGVEPQPCGTSIIRQPEPGAPFTWVHGIVRGSDGKPLKGAHIDIWHDAPDGYYDAQSPDKPQNHCRGRFVSGDDGSYSLIALKPTPYPIPYDFSAGRLLTLMDRHPYRPAHLHFFVTAPGHKHLVTQVFDRESKYLDDDAVFAVKDSLVVDFKPVTGKVGIERGEFDEAIKFELEYDITLASSSL